MERSSGALDEMYAEGARFGRTTSGDSRIITGQSFSDLRPSYRDVNPSVAKTSSLNGDFATSTKTSQILSR
jgi:hypothetical protein